MGMRETAVEQREWCHGEEYILLDEGRHLGDLVREVSSGLDVRLDTVARTVEWSRKEKETNDEGVTGSFNDGGAAVKTRCGKTFRASVAVIVAAPVSALKETHWASGVRDETPLRPAVTACETRRHRRDPDVRRGEDMSRVP
jgi:hypothetical protein